MTTAPTPEEVRALAERLEHCVAKWGKQNALSLEAYSAVKMMRRLQAENERLQGSLEAQRLISDRAIALANELEARKPLPLSDDDRLRLRSDVARAIWDVIREHEDRCDHALEDVDPKHQVWDCADAAIKAVRLQCDTPRYCSSVQRCTAGDERRSKPAYRVLDAGKDIIGPDDEFLQEDATTWARDPGLIFVGMAYCRVLKPARRRITGGSS